VASWDHLAPTLEGALVRVEPLAAHHQEALRKAADDPEVWRWISFDASASPEAFQQWFKTSLDASAAGHEAAFAIVDRSTNLPIGSSRFLALRPEHRSLEIGWTWLRQSAWRTGANTETKLLLLGYAFDELGCIRVELKTDERNERSRAAIAEIGAQFEGIFRNHMIVRDGAIRHSAYYSITNEDWPAVRAALRARLERHAAAPPPQPPTA
jgi:RimJ/RimL family protein N-acetyltransferase